MSTAMMYKAAVLGGLPRWRRSRNAAPVFCFHNVVEDREANRFGDRSLHIGQSLFAECIDRLERHYDIIPLPELIERVAGGTRLTGTAAITFDDASAGVFSHALPELRRRGIPSTMFVVSGASEAPDFFWWDVLGERGQLSMAARDRALHELNGERQAVLEAFRATGSTSLPQSFLPASWDRLRETLAADLTVGVHTRRHVNLASAAIDPVAELKEARERIEERLGVTCALGTYPYGLFDDRAAGAARSIGLRAMLAMTYGCVRPGDDLFRLRRINVPASITPDALECWAAEVRWRR
jgi:peptidoglycan/xylan/chitin deacetylase (PgdA/CDA1 family)